jgi:PAS domain S-box-containing protein
MAGNTQPPLRSTSLSPYELIFKATNDVLYDLDVQAGTVLWNEALYTEYGYHVSPEINTLEWWSGHIHLDDALTVESRIAVWLEGTEDSWQAEYRFAKADGTYKYVRDRGYVIRARDGTPERIIGSFLDITQQKQLDRAKDEFISLVSHQLRTPLTVIRIYGEMLSNQVFGPLTPDQKLEVERMTNASIRLIKLVSDILDASKIELQRVAVEPRPTDVNRVIEQYINEVLPIAMERGVEISFTPQPAATSVSIDATIFGQIIHNYLTNAVRYARLHNGHVLVAFDADVAGYTLSVQDDGIGIPRADQGRIFERFYRAKNAANIEEHGTGLGLYLVKLLSEASGGNVWFKSIESERTTFYFHLPPEGMTINSAVKM